MDPETTIKNWSLELGADAVGIASVEEINKYAPAGHRPGDLLPGAQSVVVLAGRPFLRGARRSPHGTVHSNNNYFPDIRKRLATWVARRIESRYGHCCLANMQPPSGLNGFISLKLCAEAAGLGSRALAGGVVLNREFGLLNYQICITTMPLTADGPDPRPVCPHPSCVKLWSKRGHTPCLAACPDCLSGEIEDGLIKWMSYDRRVCATRPKSSVRALFSACFRSGSKNLTGKSKETCSGANSAGGQSRLWRMARWPGNVSNA